MKPAIRARYVAIKDRLTLKAIISRRLHARIPTAQRTEAKVGCNILSRMTGLGTPVSADSR